MTTAIIVVVLLALALGVAYLMVPREGSLAASTPGGSDAILEASRPTASIRVDAIEALGLDPVIQFEAPHGVADLSAPMPLYHELYIVP